MSNARTSPTARAATRTTDQTESANELDSRFREANIVQPGAGEAKAKATPPPSAKPKPLPVDPNAEIKRRIATRQTEVKAIRARKAYDERYGK